MADDKFLFAFDPENSSTTYMARKSKRPGRALRPPDAYGQILADVVELLEVARRTSSRVVNAVMTATYWQIGRRIVEVEQRGTRRAEYGENLLSCLAVDLSRRFGRGFSRQNLQSMRAFYIAYSGQNICQTASGKSVRGIRQITSGNSGAQIVQSLSAPFPLPWSHYVRLLSVENPHGRRFYETEALRGGWTVKQ